MTSSRLRTADSGALTTGGSSEEPDPPANDKLLKTPLPLIAPVVEALPDTRPASTLLDDGLSAEIAVCDELVCAFAIDNPSALMSAVARTN